MMTRWIRCASLAASMLLAAVAVASSKDVRLSGAGATFPAPLYTLWVSEFQKLHPTIKIDYRSIGSGGGVKAITDRTVAFGASDAPLNAREIEALGGPDAIVHIPTVAGGVVPAYNLPGVTAELKFTGEIIADIYLGKISSWDDPRLREINPGVTLPRLAITPVFRTDGSGTTFVFTSYLATQSPIFAGEIGAGKQVNWPLGQGGKGNEGVAAAIQQTRGALGYVEQNYAAANKIAYGAVRNSKGNFIRATPATMSAAGEGHSDALKGTVFQANIWNAAGPDAYPISAFTYLIFFRNLDNLVDAADAEAFVKFVRWAVSDGQKFAADLEYAPLSPEVRAQVESVLDRVTHKGQPLSTAK